MTRGAKIVVFSVVGLFMLAGIYYGFIAPTNPATSTDDTLSSGTTPSGLGSSGMGSSGLGSTDSLTVTTGPAPIDPLLSGSGVSATTDPMSSSTLAGFPIRSTQQPVADGMAGGPAFGPTGTNPIAPSVTSGGTVTPAFPSNGTTPQAITVVDNNTTPNPAFPGLNDAAGQTAPKTPKPAAKKPATNYTIYTVKAGDTLSGIAGEWFKNVDNWQAIVDVNPGLKPSALKVGQKINLPARASKSTGKSATKAVASTESKPVTPSSASTSQHVVTSGETLASISGKVYGDSKSWRKIYEANKGVIGDNPSALKIGMKLTIPAKQG